MAFNDDPRGAELADGLGDAVQHVVDVGIVQLLDVLAVDFVG